MYFSPFKAWTQDTGAEKYMREAEMKFDEGRR
jgi:hypothetical protein